MDWWEPEIPLQVAAREGNGLALKSEDRKDKNRLAVSFLLTFLTVQGAVEVGVVAVA